MDKFDQRKVGDLPMNEKRSGRPGKHGAILGAAVERGGYRMEDRGFPRIPKEKKKGTRGGGGPGLEKPRSRLTGRGRDMKRCGGMGGGPQARGGKAFVCEEGGGKGPLNDPP